LAWLALGLALLASVPLSSALTQNKTSKSPTTNAGAARQQSPSASQKPGPAKTAAARGDDRTADSHTPEPRGKIAFASDRDGNFEIYIMNPDGGGLFRVTNNPAEDTHPTWSPDGTKLAFVSNRDGNKEIYVVNADGSGTTRLTNNTAEDFEPAWSPSTATPKIAFVSHRDGNDEIYLMNADGTNQTNLTQNGADDDDPAWSPSGTQLAFASNRDGDKFEIYSMNADGTGQTRLTNNAFNDLAPTWSPGQISFQTDRDMNDEIYRMNTNGAGQTRLTNNPAFDLDPARSSDGARLVFVSNRDGDANLEIYAANPDGSNVVRLTNNPASDIDPAVQPLFTPGTIQFGPPSVGVSENAGSVTVAVTRTGDTTGSAVVDVATVSGTASERSDFMPVFRTLTFAPGETSKNVTILIVNDALFEPDESLTLTLSNPVGATLGAPSAIPVNIFSDDNFGVTANPIDTTQFFVRQQYLDFLNREPDPPGLMFWSNSLDTMIAQCPASPPADRARCILGARANVSVAFFLSIEFQQTGYLVIRAYQSGLGRLPTYREFLADVQEIQAGVIIGQPGAMELLAANRRAFLDNFVAREEFQTRHAGTSNTAYVNALFTNAGVDPASEAATRDAVIAGLNDGTETRATALLKVVETKSVFNVLYNRAFVLTQYIGYLRRNPSDPPDNNLSGFNFWLAKLDSFSVPGEDVRDPGVASARVRRAQMVEAFIDSTEYRARFGTP
jgi:Tol biopolymer transport system component